MPRFFNKARGVRVPMPAGTVVARLSGTGTGKASLVPLSALADHLVATGKIGVPGSVAGLSAVADGDILANISGGSAIPTGQTITAVWDHVFGNTTGRVFMRGTSAWGATAISGDATLSASGALTIANNAITTAKINNTAVTYAKIQNGASNGLLGVNSGAAPSEVAIGTGLTLSGGTLSASGGGGSFNNTGAWSGTVGYSPFDVAQFTGASYLCFSTVSAPAAGSVTLDTTNKAAAVTLSGGNLAATMGSGTGGGTAQTGTTAVAGVAHKLYWEITPSGLSNNATGVGISIVNPNLAFNQTHQFFNASALGTIFNGNSSTGFSFAGWTNGRTGAIAVDFGAQLFWVADNAATPNWNQGTSGTQNPSTGAGGIPFDSAFNGVAMLPCYFMGSGGGEGWTFNLGGTSFAGTLPTGFSSWDSLATGSPNTSPDLDDAHWLCQGAALADITGLGTGIATALGINTGSAGAPVLFNGAGGTPSSLTLTSATGLPISTGVSGLGTGVATALAIAVGTASGILTKNGALGTPSSGTLTNATGLPAASVVAGALAAGMAATTQTAGDDSTKLATTAYVDNTYPPTSTGSWTPSDQSGASLTFTSVSANYTKIGNMVFAYAQLSYPSTADGTTALIGGLPFTAANANYAKGTFTFVGPVTTHALCGIIAPNTKTFHIYDDGAGSFYINSQLSGVTLIFTAIYPVA